MYLLLVVFFTFWMYSVLYYIHFVCTSCSHFIFMYGIQYPLQLVFLVYCIHYYFVYGVLNSINFVWMVDCTLSILCVQFSILLTCWMYGVLYWLHFDGKGKPLSFLFVYMVHCACYIWCVMCCTDSILLVWHITLIVLLYVCCTVLIIIFCIYCVL